MRDARQGLAAMHDARLPRQADIGVVQDELRRIAVALRLVLDIAQARELAGAAGVLLPFVELDEMGPHPRPGDRRDELGDRGHDASSVRMSYGRDTVSRGIWRSRSTTLISATSATAKAMSTTESAAIVGSCQRCR